MPLGKRKIGEEDGADEPQQEEVKLQWPLYTCNKDVPVDVSMVRLWMDTLDPEKQKYCDLKISVDTYPNEVLYVHACVVAPKCPFISSLLETTLQESNSREIVLRDPETQSPKVLRAILFFLYTGAMTTDDVDYCTKIYRPAKGRYSDECWGCNDWQQVESEKCDGLIAYKIATFLQLDDVRHTMINTMDHHMHDCDDESVSHCIFHLWQYETCPVFKSCILKKMSHCMDVNYLVKVMDKLPRQVVYDIIISEACNFITWGATVIPMYKSVFNLDEKEVGNACIELERNCDYDCCCYKEVNLKILKNRSTDNAVPWYIEALRALACIETFHERTNRLSDEFRGIKHVSERCKHIEQCWSVKVLWPLLEKGPYNVPAYFTVPGSVQTKFQLSCNEKQLCSTLRCCDGRVSVDAAFEIAINNPYSP